MTNTKPGQLRKRARSSRPKQVVQQLGPVQITSVRNGVPTPQSLEINPAKFGCAEPLVRHLANQWKAQYEGGSWNTANDRRLGVRRVGQYWQEAGIGFWFQVTVRVLKEIEHLRLSYSSVRTIWQSLEELPEGALDSEAAQLVRSPPNIPRRPSQATEHLSTPFLSAILKAAMADVAKAEHRISAASWDGISEPPNEAFLSRAEVMAFYILLCFEWSNSPEVITDLSFNPHRDTSVQDWGEDTGQVLVKARKKRAAGQYHRQNYSFPTDKKWRAGSILRRLRNASAANRQFMGGDWSDTPWICVDPIAELGARVYRSGRLSDHPIRWLPDGSALVPHPLFHVAKQNLHSLNFLKWCHLPRKRALRIEVPAQYADKAQPLLFKAIRPAAKWAQFQATGKGLLLSGVVDDNTIEVLSAHYLNGATAMLDIAEAWKDIPNLAEEIARGLRPVVVDEDGQVISGHGRATEDQITVALDGRSSVGTASCQDLFASPLTGQRSGQVCRLFNRSCYFCPNSIVTPADVPFMKQFLLLAEQASRYTAPPQWQLDWGRTVRWIMWVLPQLDPAWESVPIGDALAFDLGLRTGPL